VSFLPYVLGSRLAQADLERQPLAALLPARYGTPIRRAEQTVEPVVADVEVAEQLGVPVGAPPLLVERDFFGQRGVPVYHSRTFYRGDRYTFTVALRLRGEPARGPRRGRG
jgi:GntR family transcriptional regulator